MSRYQLVTAVEGSTGKRTAHEFALAVLRRAILDGTLPGGTRLVQTDIASELELSTTPVREALRDLAAEGLVRLDTHRGAVVPTINAEEMAEIYNLRLLLEPYCLRLAAERIDGETLEAARRLLHEMEDEDGVGAYVELNRRFHHLLVEASGSPRAATILKALQDSASLYVAASLSRTAPDRRQGNEDHQAILAALDARDADAAAEASVRHLEHTMALVGDAFAR